MAFKGSLKRFKYLSKLGLFAITLIFAVNLIFLGDKILYDIANWVPVPLESEYKSQDKLDELNKEQQALDKQLKELNEERFHIEQALNRVRRDYASQKKSFETWIEARKAMGSPQEDKAVRDKANELDEQRKVVAEWESKLDGHFNQKRKMDQELQNIYNKRIKIENQDSKAYNSIYKIYTIKVFFVRLAFVLPILLLGLYLFLKHRKTKFRALVWGYILFALYAFFIGLLPYLPHYGGYIRYLVGILLTAFIGYYLIKQLSRYTARKEAELQESNEERAKKVEHEVAIKAFDTHSCPSCEQDFLKNKWRPQTKKWQDTIDEYEAPDYCRHCGLILFTNCPACGTRNFAHFPFCSSCGKTLSVINRVEESREENE